MKKTVLFLLLAFISLQPFAQNFTGQWKGEFVDNSTSFSGWGGTRCDYVLELEVNGTHVTGYSYTYFNEGGKKYYTICRLKGTVNKPSKAVEVTEVERTKTNVPSNIRNCFQIHRLTYFQQGETQTLEGSWVPAPNQVGDCGFGTTTLSRRMLKKTPTVYNNSKTITVKPSPKNNQTVKAPVKKTVPPVKQPTIAKVNPAPVKKDKEIAKVQRPVESKLAGGDQDSDKQPQVNKDNNSKIDLSFEKRNNTLLKTIEIANDKFKVDLYDNGEIDGDSISLFFNGKLLLYHKRLSDKAISLELTVDPKTDVNELIMYAENLGSIPPNTALMVVTDGDKRYEVRIASDLEKSGSIRFIHKPK